MTNQTIYKFSVQRMSENNPSNLEEILPASMKFEFDQSKIHLVLTTQTNDVDEARLLVEREANRIYFLTKERLEPQLVEKINPDGKKEHYVLLTAPPSKFKVPPSVDKQIWNEKITRQLNLWDSTYSSSMLERIKLWFQIIEISYPNTMDTSHYPQYDDHTKPPHPRTESKLLRDLVSHQKDIVKSTQLQNYCIFLGLPQEFYNPTDAESRQVITSRMTVIREEALKIVESFITKK